MPKIYGKMRKMSLKMKVGDFVRLSAYGKKLKGNKSIGKSLGVVSEHYSCFYFVWWLCGDRTISSRRDLKYFRREG